MTLVKIHSVCVCVRACVHACEDLRPQKTKQNLLQDNLYNIFKTWQFVFYLAFDGTFLNKCTPLKWTNNLIYYSFYIKTQWRECSHLSINDNNRVAKTASVPSPVSRPLQTLHPHCLLSTRCPLLSSARANLSAHISPTKQNQSVAAHLLN